MLYQKTANKYSPDDFIAMSKEDLVHAAKDLTDQLRVSSFNN